MSRHGFISMAVIRRLPRYYRYLHEMYLSGMKQISSRELADCMELTASQVRQDFNCFGAVSYTHLTLPTTHTV